MTAAAISDAPTSHPTLVDAPEFGTAGTTPGPAEPSLTAEVAASLALLRHIGGEGYIGPADNPERNTIAQSSVAALHAHGLVDIRHRPAGDVVTLTETDAP